MNFSFSHSLSIHLFSTDFFFFSLLYLASLDDTHSRSLTAVFKDMQSTYVFLSEMIRFIGEKEDDDGKDRHMLKMISFIFKFNRKKDTQLLMMSIHLLAYNRSISLKAKTTRLILDIVVDF